MILLDQPYTSSMEKDLEYAQAGKVMFDDISISKTILYISENNASYFVDILKDNYTRYFTITIIA